MRTHILSLILTTLAVAPRAHAAEVYTRGAAGGCQSQDNTPISALGPTLVNLEWSMAHWSCGLEVGPPLVPAQNIRNVTLWFTDRSPTEEIYAALCFQTPGTPEVCGKQIASSGTGVGLTMTLPRPVGTFPAGTVAWISVFVPTNTTGAPFAHSGVDAWRVNN
jgi:hypothetical protein